MYVFNNNKHASRALFNWFASSLRDFGSPAKFTVAVCVFTVWGVNLLFGGVILLCRIIIRDILYISHDNTIGIYEGYSIDKRAK